jgi:hypothetical protein
MGLSITTAQAIGRALSQKIHIRRMRGDVLEVCCCDCESVAERRRFAAYRPGGQGGLRQCERAFPTPEVL